jgi:hypothetical protein
MRAGIPELGPCRQRAQQHIADPQVALADRPPCRGPDDRRQLLQPRDPRSLSDVSPSAARACRRMRLGPSRQSTMSAPSSGALSVARSRARRRRIMIAALLSLPVLPQWAFAESPRAAGDRRLPLRVMVQGAWGDPRSSQRASPDEARGTFPAFVCQRGNLLASANATIQAGIAVQFGGNYGLALALVAGSVAVIIAVLTSLGGRRGGLGRRSPATDPRLRGRCGNGIASDQSRKRGGSLLTLTQGTKNGALDRLGKALVVIGIGG